MCIRDSVYSVRPGDAGAGDTSGLGEPDLALLRTLIDVIPARVVVFDPEHRYRYVNKEFLDFVGRPAAAVIGRHAVELLGEEAYAHYVPMTARVAAGETVRWEGWISYPKHGPRYVQEALAPYVPADGGFQALVVFSRDLTRLKQRELELAQNLEALRASESLNRAVVSSALDCIVVIDEVEALWAPIAAADDWGAFAAKIEAVREMGEAYGNAPPDAPA